MFEQLVRPFQTRLIGTTRRIIPVKTDDTPEDARITWGSTGNLAQGVVQPKGVNLENIESVGWNLRGNIDNFNQSSRRSEFIDLDIKDEAGNTVGKATIDRANEIDYQKRYMPNFNNQSSRSNREPFTYEAGTKPKRNDITPATPTVIPVSSGTNQTPPGLRANVPGKDVSGRSDVYVYP